MGEVATGFSSASGLPLPRMLGRRILLRLVARGGMGDVYLAATTGIEGAERPCIVKTVRRDHIHDGSFLARFLDEARVQAQLQHPGVAQVLEAATDEQGEPYTVVEYVEGRSLSDVRQRAIQLGVRIGWAEAVGVAIEVAQALAHVHERPGADGSPLGIVHRDLSPQNVMVGYTGEVKLIDFGTARGHNRQCHTVAGVVFAKPGYVAPEVARQQVGDGRIDLYALGIVLWEICAGRRFLSTDPQRHLDDAAAGKVVVPPVAEACGAPPELDEVIARLTRNDPDERYARASQAVHDLARVLSSAPPAESGERGVRARIALLMQGLWAHEPARSRAEFVRLLRDARASLRRRPACRGDPERRSGQRGDGATNDPGRPFPARRNALPPHAQDRRGRDRHRLGGASTSSSVGAWRSRFSRRSMPRRRRRSSASGERRARWRASRTRTSCRFSTSANRSTVACISRWSCCAGETLGARLQRGPVGWREAVAIAVQASRALAAAHGAGLVHRDLKPENLMIIRPEGEPRPGAGRRGVEVKLLDFGVATAIADDTHRRRSTPKERALGGFAIFGTPEYMAPEQVAGEVIDGRTDLYALGCVLYEMLTGEGAFAGPSSVVVMGKQLRETPASPRARAPALAIPGEVEAVVLRAMAKLPAERFSSADAMREALERTLALPEQRHARLRRVATAAAMALSVAGTAAGSAYWTTKLHAGTAIANSNAADTLPETRAHPAPVPAAMAAASEAVTPAAPSAPAIATAPAATASRADPSSGAAAGAGPASRARSPEESAPALRDARAVARAHPGDPRALAAWAQAALRAGELREARRATSSWALRDGTVEPRLVMAQVLAASGRRADAVATLTEWLESHPDSTDARLALTSLSGGAPGALGAARERDTAKSSGSGEAPAHELARR